MQFISDCVFGDAASVDCLRLDRFARGWGWETAIFARRTDDHYRAVAQPYECYQPRLRDRVVFHYTGWSGVASFLRERGWPLVLVYHNVTPHQYLVGLDPFTVSETKRGRDELPSFAAQTRIALGKSEYSRRELAAVGFEPTGVLPFAVDFDALAIEPNPDVLARFGDGRALVLVVGRAIPNKRLEDALKAFAHYHRTVDARSRLVFVGSHDEEGVYCTWLRRLAQVLNVTEAVHFLGQVPQADLVALYRLARVLVTMSEHEGFCVPVVEAMHLGIPVIARAAAAIPETVGAGGVLVGAGRPRVVGELIGLLAKAGELRDHIVAAGRRRAADFASERIETLFREYLMGEYLMREYLMGAGAPIGESTVTGP